MHAHKSSHTNAPPTNYDVSFDRQFAVANLRWLTRKTKHNTERSAARAMKGTNYRVDRMGARIEIAKNCKFLRAVCVQ